MKTYFKFIESSNNGWTIHPIHDEFMDVENRTNIPTGSYGLIACRISGLSWPQWLRYCRQHGAQLYGKGHKYPAIVWKEPNQDFLKELNMRANELAKLINLKELHL